jgi:hypothetical protein
MYLKKIGQSTNSDSSRFHGETKNTLENDKRLPGQALGKEYEKTNPTILK